MEAYLGLLEGCDQHIEAHLVRRRPCTRAGRWNEAVGIRCLQGRQAVFRACSKRGEAPARGIWPATLDVLQARLRPRSRQRLELHADPRGGVRWLGASLEPVGPHGQHAPPRNGEGHPAGLQLRLAAGKRLRRIVEISRVFRPVFPEVPFGRGGSRGGAGASAQCRDHSARRRAPGKGRVHWLARGCSEAARGLGCASRCLHRGGPLGHCRVLL
mmetsp:Transcript_21566/g.73954  ORF Transcript_21566/g.73954 Transcript_21566/m.73954 type:complete len:214 (-) Transcript_21566:2937-3578(-)